MVKSREIKKTYVGDERGIREDSVGILEDQGDPALTEDEDENGSKTFEEEDSADPDEESNDGTKYSSSKVPTKAEGSYETDEDSRDSIKPPTPKGTQIEEDKWCRGTTIKSTKKYRYTKEKNGNWNLHLYAGVGVIILCAISYLFCGNQAQNLTKSQEFKKNLLKLKQQFPNQEKSSWVTIYKQVNYVNVSQPQRPAVLLLMHNNAELTAECLAWQIANEAKKFFERESFIEIIGDILNYEYNEMVKEYKLPLVKKVVMLVHKLHKMAPSVVKSFHPFCDYYNPLVKRAVIIFTLDESVLNENEIDNKPNRRATKVMKSLWGAELIDSTLNSLITRLTETVIEIKQEKESKCPKN